MRLPAYYYYNRAIDRLPIDDPSLDYATAQQRMQRMLADKINRFAPIDELRLLLVSGARADGIVTLGLTPLHYACYRDYFDAAKLLIVRGAKVDAVDDIGYSSLHLAAEKGNHRILKLLLEHLVNRTKCFSFESKDQDYPIRDGADEPLRLAILQNHYECAKLLLESGANPNTRYFDGPQITLLDPKELPYIRLLLDFGASPNIPARNGMSLLMKSCEMGAMCFKTSQILIEHGADVSAINFKSTYPMSVLHYAIGSGHAQTVRLLLEKGAKVDIRDQLPHPNIGSHPSALHFAVMSGNTEIVKLLLEYNADPHTCDAIYGNALHLATCFRIGSQNHAELVKLLLIHGADPNRGVVNSNGVMLRSPVVEYFRRLYKHSAESGNQTNDWIKIVQLLFSYGGHFEISPENLETTSMAMREPPRIVPPYADALNYYVMRLASGSTNVGKIDPENSIYASVAQLKNFGSNPRPLLELCRNYIRTYIKVLPSNVDQLPIPYFAKDYLLCLSDLPAP